MSKLKSLGFIGAGNMGAALMRGACKTAIVNPGDLWIYDPDTAKTGELSTELSIRVAESGQQVLEKADNVILAVKPQIISDVLAALHSGVRPGQLFISIAAGIPCSLIEDALGPDAIVVRTMPNTPAMLSLGATAIAPGSRANAEHIATAKAIFDSVGVAVEVEESQINAVTGLSGSGPAYVFRMVEALTRAGVAAGLSPEVSDKLARQTVLGAATMAANPDADPADLRRRVTSPGGTTEAGLQVMDEADFMLLIQNVVIRARDRGQELGKVR